MEKLIIIPGNEMIMNGENQVVKGGGLCGCVCRGKEKFVGKADCFSTHFHFVFGQVSAPSVPPTSYHDLLLFDFLPKSLMK